MSEILDLRAQLAEYEHALVHVIQCATCEDCKRLATSAINGVNREDFADSVGFDCLYSECECSVCDWWCSCGCNGPEGVCSKASRAMM